MERIYDGESLVDLLLSWSIDDLLNRDLFKDKVRKIPKTFSSTAQYLNSFVYPLIEEMRADLSSSVKSVSGELVREVKSVEIAADHNPLDNLVYKVELYTLDDIPTNQEMYEPETGDVIAFTNQRPKGIDDLDFPRGAYHVALVQRAKKNSSLEGNDALEILSSKLMASDENGEKNRKRESIFIVFLTNMTTNIRIWKALNSELGVGNLSIIEKVLTADSTVGENCRSCFSKERYSIDVSCLGSTIRSFNLNDSQEEAVFGCLAARECCHRKSIRLIWGPPGTGKTKTVASLLSTLLRKKCRTLTCAPTNVAVIEVATRLLTLVMGSFEFGTYGLGDIVLFGNEQRMKIADHEDLLDVFLDYRADILAQCFAPLSGWNYCLKLTIGLLEDPEKLYHEYLKLGTAIDKEENNDNQERESCTPGNEHFQNNQGHRMMSAQILKTQRSTWKNIITQTLKKNKRMEKEKEKTVKQENIIEEFTFEEFVMKEFNFIRKRMKFCIINIYTHLPTSLISLRIVKKMLEALELIENIGSSLCNPAIIDYLLGINVSEGNRLIGSTERLRLRKSRKDCLEILKSLGDAFTSLNQVSKYGFKTICLKHANLVFCTASSSARMHADGLGGVEIVVIDEAAQLKECESAIPLQLPGLRHAVLIGDERQLPAMVQSKISEKAEFGRSLFERLVLLGMKRNLLNVQYRMHPSISIFPNTEFYNNQILDAASTKERGYQKHFLQGKMYGPYSFINVAYGEEELEGSDDGHSHKNMVEVAVVYDLVTRLFEESSARKHKFSVGVISPYKAQVNAIQDKLAESLNINVYNDFTVNVRTVDGFQGGEEDVIIISTVRCNGFGIVGFLSNPQRTNVALTRARYCLWIVGNGETLFNSGSIWEKLVIDAKSRECFYNADEDENLSLASVVALVELKRFDILLSTDSLLFGKKARWKVSFSDIFWTSIEKFRAEVRKEVILLLRKLSNGWRQSLSQQSQDIIYGAPSELLEEYKIYGLSLIWSVDILMENSSYTQILKVWDVLPSTLVPNLVNHLETILGNYSMEQVICCKMKCFEGDFVVPMTWQLNLSEVDPVRFQLNRLSSLTLGDEMEASL